MSRRRTAHPGSYHLGRTQRQARAAKLACPYPFLSSDWAWWLAGWNDMDIEIEAKTERPATPSPVANPIAA